MKKKMIKDLPWLVFALLLGTAVIIMALISSSSGGSLTDFTKTGMTFVEKTEKEKYRFVDLTQLMRVKDYSHYVPEINEYIFEGLLISPKDFDINKSPHEVVINALKQCGERGQIALPAFRIIKNGETIGFKILTSAIIITVEKDLTEEAIQKLVEKITPGCTLKKIEEGSFEINLSLKSTLNPFEMTTELSKHAEITSCGPAFIECPLQKNLPPLPIEEEPEGWPFDI